MSTSFIKMYDKQLYILHQKNVIRFFSPLREERRKMEEWIKKKKQETGKKEEGREGTLTKGPIFK